VFSSVRISKGQTVDTDDDRGVRLTTTTTTITDFVDLTKTNDREDAVKRPTPTIDVCEYCRSRK
jgi:hypothetical protein